MLIVNLFRFLCGYVSFTAVGGFGDRFINLCNVHSIPIFNISYKDKGICACVPVKKIYKLKTVCKKSGVCLELNSEHGAYFYIKKHCDRPGLFVSVVFYLVFCFAMQNFIWAIDIQQSNNVPVQNIYDLLYDNGLKFGTYIKSFDEIHCSRSIVNTLKDKIQWMAVNIKGSKAFVEIHDYNITPKESAYGNPCNIIADFDGVLLNIDTYKGETVAIAGNGVNKGDLLISGIIENRDMSVTYCEARGKITALHTVKIDKNFDRKKSYCKVSQAEQKSYYYILGIKIPVTLFSLKQLSFTHSNELYITMNKNRLPFGYLKFTDFDYTDTFSSVKEKERFLLALEEYTDTVYKDMSESFIVDSKLNLSVNDDKYKISTNFTCIDFIGEKQEINTNIF